MMRRAILFALGAFAGAVLAADWDAIAYTAKDTVWEVRRGSIVTSSGGSTPVHTADIRMTQAGVVTTYRAEVPVIHCYGETGDLVLFDTSGAPVSRSVWRKGSGLASWRIADAICQRATRSPAR